MHVKATLLTLLLLAWAGTAANAAPILSADGRYLNNVDVNGMLYDVTFGDGVMGDYYTIAQVEAPGWLELSQSVSKSIVTALNSLGSPVKNSDINGCKDGPGFPGFVEPNTCVMILPQYVTQFGSIPPLYFAADFLPVLYGDNGTAYYAANDLGLTVSETIDTGRPGFIGDLQTIAVFKVPTPATPALICIALIGVGLSRAANKFVRIQEYSHERMH